MKILSGGQTGADRAALDFAIAHRIPHGGWCPHGRQAEDGPIPSNYHLQETPSPAPAQRTEWNVRDSDATVIFSISENLSGGSLLAQQFATQYAKPCLHLSKTLTESLAQAPSVLLQIFLSDHRVHALNVAGPRASEEPDIAKFVTSVLEKAFINLSPKPRKPH